MARAPAPGEFGLAGAPHLVSSFENALTELIDPADATSQIRVPVRRASQPFLYCSRRCFTSASVARDARKKFWFQECAAESVLKQEKYPTHLGAGYFGNPESLIYLAAGSAAGAAAFGAAAFLAAALCFLA